PDQDEVNVEVDPLRLTYSPQVQVRHDLYPSRFDNFADSVTKLGCFVRFGNHATKSKILIVAHGGIHRITARNNCVHRRIDFEQKFKRISSAYPAGKSEIEDDTLKSLTGLKFLSIKLNTLQRGCGRANFIAKMTQGEFHQRADGFFVIDD